MILNPYCIAVHGYGKNSAGASHGALINQGKLIKINKWINYFSGSYPPVESSPKKFFGKGNDRRKQVENPREYPWWCFGTLVMDYGGGTRYVGSGTIIAPSYVLTAAHNIYTDDTRIIPRRIIFFSGIVENKKFFSNPSYGLGRTKS